MANKAACKTEIHTESVTSVPEHMTFLFTKSVHKQTVDKSTPLGKMRAKVCSISLYTHTIHKKSA